MRTTLHDLRYAVRSLAKSPGLTGLAILCLALGIGANSTIFSIVDGMWLRPLPIARPGEMIEISATFKGRTSGMSYPDYEDFRDHSKTLAGLIAQTRFGPLLGEGEQAEPVMATAASENYFTVLGVKAARGRVFTDADADEPVLVISHGLWQRRFGGDPGLVGKQVALNSRSFTVIGVAPRAFRGTYLSLDIDIWVPRAWRGATRDRSNREFEVMGRLRPGVSIEQARAELEAIARNLERAYPDTHKQCGVLVEDPRAEIGREPYLLLGIVGLVLLIACANVANLLLARAEARRREIAIRVAIGAGRGRIVRQLLTESALLAGVGTAVALAFAWWMIETVPGLVIAPSPRGIGYAFLFDGRVLAFTLLVSIATIVIFGLVPALSASRPDLVPALKSETSGGGRRIRLRDVLVVAQVALSLVALTSAGLLVRSFLASLQLDLGFERRDLLLVHIYTPYRPPQARLFFNQLTEKVRAISGVRQVTLAVRPPMWLSEGGMSVGVSIPGYVAPDGESRLRVKDLTIGPDYFQTIGTRFLLGRDFGERDNETGGKVAIVNETMARRFWPNESPIGKIVRIAGGEEREIAGVVQDTKINHPGEDAEPYIYFPFAQSKQTYMSLMVRTDGDPLDYVAAVKAQMAALDPSIRPYQVWTFRNLIRRRFFTLEQRATMVSSLGLLGLILAAVGLYGVVSYSVMLRTREIGIRMALGGTRADALALVIRHGLRVSLIGVALGLPLALLSTPLLEKMLYRVKPYDPVTLAAVAALMVAVAVAASWFPARRATKVDPLAALRYE